MNNQIRFGEPLEFEVPTEKLPSEALIIIRDPQLVAKIRSKSFQAYILKDVHEKILGELRESGEYESGGILIGHPFKTFSGQVEFVVIVGAIAYETKNRSKSQLVVGSEEIEKAKNDLVQKYPGYVIVGWYHSHPSYGVFLSEQDRTIVRSIHNAPWSIALIIDPIHNTEGIFVSSEGIQINKDLGSEFGASWLEIKKVPEETTAIVLYNKIKLAIEQERITDAKRDLQSLDRLINREQNLDHWNNDYRSLSQLKEELIDLEKKKDTHEVDQQLERRKKYIRFIVLGIIFVLFLGFSVLALQLLQTQNANNPPIDKSPMISVTLSGEAEENSVDRKTQTPVVDTSSVIKEAPSFRNLDETTSVQATPTKSDLITNSLQLDDESIELSLVIPNTSMEVLTRSFPITNSGMLSETLEVTVLPETGNIEVQGVLSRNMNARSNPEVNSDNIISILPSGTIVYAIAINLDSDWTKVYVSDQSLLTGNAWIYAIDNYVSWKNDIDQLPIDVSN